MNLGDEQTQEYFHLPGDDEISGTTDASEERSARPTQRGRRKDVKGKGQLDQVGVNGVMPGCEYPVNVLNIPAARLRQVVLLYRGLPNDQSRL